MATEKNLPEKLILWFVELIFEYASNISAKDIQIGAKFQEGYTSVNLSLLERAIKDSLSKRDKTAFRKKAIGKGVKEDTAKAQYELYKDLYPDTNLKWRDFLKKSEKKPRIFKKEPLTKSERRDQASRKINQFFSRKKRTLKSIIETAVREKSPLLFSSFQDFKKTKNKKEASLIFAAIAASLSTIALNRVGFDGPVLSGGVSLVSTYAGVYVYEALKGFNSALEGSSSSIWDQILEKNDNIKETSLKRSVRSYLHFF